MRERQRAARFADFLPQPIGFVKTVCHRLVEHDVETPVERGHSRLEMEKVGRYIRTPSGSAASRSIISRNEA